MREKKNIAFNKDYLQKIISEKNLKLPEICEELGRNRNYIAQCKNVGNMDVTFAKALCGTYGIDYKELTTIKKENPKAVSNDYDLFEKIWGFEAKYNEILNRLDSFENLLCSLTQGITKYKENNFVPMLNAELKGEITLSNLLQDYNMGVDELLVERAFENNGVPKTLISSCIKNIGATRKTIEVGRNKKITKIVWLCDK